MADISADFWTWSATAGSNNPGGSTAVGAGLDDNLRAVQAALRGALQPLTSVAGTNTITANSANLSAYATGQRFVFVPANTNAGATTLNIGGLGAKNIFAAGAACVGGEIVANVPLEVEYDGTQFNIIGFFAFNALTSETAVATGDFLPLYDVSESGYNRVSIANLFLVINGFTADATPDPTADYVVTYDASAAAAKKVLLQVAAQPTLGTAVATTSGTTAAFSSLPTGLNEIVFMLKDVSTNGTSTLNLQLSTGTTFKTSGYNGVAYATGGSGTAAGGAGLPITVNAIAANTYKGNVYLKRESGNTWSYTAIIGAESAANTPADCYTCAGWVTLGGALDGIRLTSTSGDTFDNGEVNIQYR